MGAGGREAEERKRVRLQRGSWRLGQGREQGGFPFPPLSAHARQPIPTLLERRERKEQKAKRKKILLIIWHVSARCPGSNDSDPTGTPRTCVIGPVQTEEGCQLWGRTEGGRSVSGVL